MSSEFWAERWARKEIGFHQRSINDYLQRYWGRLAVPANARVLVPLCGKTLDMHWLREQGHCVIGVEVVRSAVAEFFDEWGVEAKITNEGGFERWQAAGIELLCGDDLLRYAPLAVACQVHCGSADGITLPEDCAALAAALAAPFDLIAGAGHACAIEQPDTVTGLLARALDASLTGSVL